jgi:uncharacterized protein (UPF0332 family)
MTLKQLLADGKLVKHRTSRQEIASLLKVVERDITDASIEIVSADRRFATAYNAALQLATIALCCKGYKAIGLGQHFTVLQTLKETMGQEFCDRANYFDMCRTKRNVTDYDRAGEISEGEAIELLQEVKDFKQEVADWLHNYYPKLAGS